jgi:adenosylcobinamide-GDP ribazoletransferase
VRAFLAGLQFLTVLPVRLEAPTSRQISGSYFFYPVIGCLVGLGAVLLRHVLSLVFPLPFAIVLMLGFLVWITGGLHEDGLADVADAIGGGWTPEQRLQIMKDSRIGAFGAAALSLALLAKYTALTSMAPGSIDAGIVAAQILGRWSFLPMGYFNPSAREGLGAQFMKGLSSHAVFWSTIVSAGAVILLSRPRGALALCMAAVIVAIASLYFRRHLGGVTGDCFGATFQFVEIATYAAFLA